MAIGRWDSANGNLDKAVGAFEAALRDAVQYGAAAGTDVSVFMSASGPLVTLFNAECTVKARNDYRWLNVNVYIDGLLVPPSNSDNAFCTSTGDNALQHWVSASTNGYRYVSAGWHRVRVTAGIAGCAAGDQFRLDDTSLIGFRGLALFPPHLSFILVVTVLS